VLVYTRKFIELDTKMSDIYVIAGIEVSKIRVLTCLVLSIVIEGSRGQFQVSDPVD
jgi:hypothetical protein